jgi:HEPN domain-containing protein
VVFLCHLSIEKTVKAIVCKRSRQMPPFTHNLNRLMELSGIVMGKPHQEFIDKISLQSVPTRYPEDFKNLSEHLNKKVTEEILQKTRKVVKWLKRNYLQEK